MKAVLVLLLVGLCAMTLCDSHGRPSKVADKAFLKKQKEILSLFYHINQPSYFKQFVDIANSFSLTENVDHYTKPEVVKQFVQQYKYGFIPRGEIFSVFYPEHLEQAVALFKLFYYAKDFETFYNTAVYARQHLNEGLFLYAVSVAIIHRPDTYGIILPPIYEVYPHYFYSSETIHEAQVYKQTYQPQKGVNSQGPQTADFNGHTINANYSGYYLNLHPEQSLSYYLEDVGINSFYYYYNLYYPFWLNGTEYGITNNVNRGELYYFLYQQITARYYLERLSNGFGEIPYLTFDVPVETPYYPSLEYPNGLEFPARPPFAKLQEYFYTYGQSFSSRGIFGYSYSILNDYERRINDAIDSGVVYTKNGERVYLYEDAQQGINVVGNLIEANADSPNYRYYGPIQLFARHLLGYSYQPLDKYQVAPSALEHFETSLRDPVVYQLYKHILGKFRRYYFHLPSYTEKDLVFPGVKVVNVEFEPLVTYFDYFYSDLSYGVYDNEQEFQDNSFKVRAKQYRLNHKPFSYKINVKSDKDTKASVKIFIGPKYDEYGRYINISQNRLNFVEFEHFTYDLKSGENVITRSSYQNQFYGPDRIPYQDLYNQVVAAYEGNGEFHIDGTQNYFNFPQRYLLPKGSSGGTAYQFYVIVYPYKPYKGQEPHEQVGEYFYPRPGTGVHTDGYPLGYPFERFIKYDQLYYQVPNSYFYEARIFHKNVEEVNAPHH